jgi:hypothetical protein
VVQSRRGRGSVKGEMQRVKRRRDCFELIDGSREISDIGWY